MKIVLVGPTHPFRGGISHYTTLLCQALMTRHDVRFFSLSRQYPELLFPTRRNLAPTRPHPQEPPAPLTQIAKRGHSALILKERPPARSFFKI